MKLIKESIGGLTAVGNLWSAEKRPQPVESGQRLSAILTAGTIVGIYGVAKVFSVAALIFSGTLAGYAGVGIGLTLISSIIIALFIGLCSGYRGMISGAQEVPAAILAQIAAAIVAGFPATASAAEIIPTVIVAIVLSSLVTGTLYWLLGHLRLGNLARFIPYPVIGGFLAATGWVLIIGGIKLCINPSDNGNQGAGWFSDDILLQWLPAASVGILLFWAGRRYKHYLTLPGLLCVVTLGFFLLLGISGISLDEAAVRGWTIKAPPGELWQPLAAVDWWQIEWSLLAAQLPAFLTLLMLSVLSLLLNVSSIELSVRQTVDLNRELRNTGIGHLLGGLSGGAPGFHALGMTALSHNLGANSRLVCICAALIMSLPLLFGAATVSLMPKMLLGGLLIYLGLDFLFNWLLQTRRRLPRSDYLIIVLILLVSITAGFLEAIGVGLIAALILFILRYLRISVIKNEFSAAIYHSRRLRTLPEQQWLRQHGDAIGILQLQGFIFFGTGQRLLERWRARVDGGTPSALRYSIIDCRLVTGLDSSALLSLTRLAQLAARHKVELIFSGFPKSVERALLAELDPLARWFEDLDQAVEWCESQLLKSAPELTSDSQGNLSGWLGAYVNDATGVERLLSYMDYRQASAGQTLVHQGDTGDEMLLIASGQVTVILDTGNGKKIRIRTMGTGSVAGEMSLYAGHMRSASVVADTDVTLYSLDRNSLSRLEHEHPELANALHRAIIRLIAERLIDTTALVRSLAL